MRFINENPRQLLPLVLNYGYTNNLEVRLFYFSINHDRLRLSYVKRNLAGSVMIMSIGKGREFINLIKGSNNPRSCLARTTFWH